VREDLVPQEPIVGRIDESQARELGGAEGDVAHPAASDVRTFSEGAKNVAPETARVKSIR